MDITRRTFLGGALTISACAVLPVPALPASYPTLYGDGVHDDTEALQALFKSKPVWISQKLVQVPPGGTIHLRGGTYRLG